MIEQLKAEPIVKKQHKKLKQKLSNLSVKPSLAIIVTAKEPATLKFVAQKQRIGERLGVSIKTYLLTSEDTNTVIKNIEKLNKDPNIHGILVQLPLRYDLNTDAIINAVSYHKDVDGLSAFNLGVLAQKATGGTVKPILPAAILALKHFIDFYQIELTGKKVAILGHGRVIGLPSVLYVLGECSPSQVKIYNSLNEKIEGDVIISGLGSAHSFGIADLVSDEVTIIDFGTSLKDGKLVGDFKPPSSSGKTTSKKIRYTPTPGGTGPVTVYAVFENLLTLLSSNAYNNLHVREA